jgi:Zn-finger nucleic acid-binding protein
MSAMAPRCPTDDSLLTERRDDDVVSLVCGTCGGAWISAEVTRGLLNGTIGKTVFVAAHAGHTPARHWTPIDAPRLAGAPPAPAKAPPGPRLRCSECRARMRPIDAHGVMTCTRCGALWIADGDLGSLADWYRLAVQVRATSALQPTRIRYGRWREIDDDFNRVVFMLAVAFAFFLVLGPLSMGLAAFAHRARALLLGASGIGLVVYSFQFPSRLQPGALTKRGFAFALAGVALGILAMLDWG